MFEIEKILNDLSLEERDLLLRWALLSIPNTQENEVLDVLRRLKAEYITTIKKGGLNGGN